MADPAIVIKDSFFKGDPDKAKGQWDDNALGFGNCRDIAIVNCVIQANGVAEGLKLSNVWDVNVKNCIISGGYEDCVDIVRGGRITFDGCVFVALNTKHHFTIKCQVSQVTIKNSLFLNPFRHWWDGACIDLGNWSDYDIDDLPKTKGIRIENCRLMNMPFYKKILSRAIFAQKPLVKNTKGLNLRIPSLFVELFWKLRRWQVAKK